MRVGAVTDFVRDGCDVLCDVRVGSAFSVPLAKPSASRQSRHEDSTHIREICHSRFGDARDGITAPTLGSPGTPRLHVCDVGDARERGGGRPDRKSVV